MGSRGYVMSTRQGVGRRRVLTGALATAALFTCEAVAPAAVKLVPTQACGCPRIHELSYGHTCTVHDESGKRWDAYTFDDIMAEYRGLKIDVQTADTDWSCYCHRHKRNADHVMAVGTRCIWQRTSYECDEWECECEHEFREQWLHSITTDWIAMMKESDREYQAERRVLDP